MKNKSTLIMIEQIVMLLVFVLAATVCIRMFVRSEQLSRKYEATDQAVRVAQNAAELLKKGGIPAFANKENVLQKGENTWAVLYDKNWEVTKRESAEFILTIDSLAEAEKFLFRAEITVLTEDGEVLFRLPVAGQKTAEVTEYEEN